jgi:hypothetical protein
MKHITLRPSGATFTMRAPKLDFNHVRKEIDGYVTPFKAYYEQTMCQAYCDEDGESKRLPINPHVYDQYGRPIRGTVVITIKEEST